MSSLIYQFQSPISISLYDYDISYNYKCNLFVHFWNWSALCSFYILDISDKCIFWLGKLISKHPILLISKRSRNRDSFYQFLIYNVFFFHNPGMDLCQFDSFIMCLICAYKKLICMKNSRTDRLPLSVSWRHRHKIDISIQQI